MIKEIKTILITSNEPWDDIWFSKQHYANELSKLGFNVYFLNPVKKWSFLNFLSFNIEIIKVSNNLKIINYKNNFPVKVFPLFFTKLNDKINERKLIKQIKTQSVIWWKFDAFRFLKNYTGKSIYHVADSYMHLWQDQYISATADIVVCTNSEYISYYKNKNYETIYIPHGVSDEEYNINKQKVKNIKEKYGEFAIIVGTINNDTNFDLIKEIADNNIKIVIIGNALNTSALWANLLKHNNIYYIGIVHATELKYYISASIVGLNVYEFNLRKEVGTRTPLKIINYLSQYKPVVSSMPSDIRELDNIAIYKADNISDFIKKTKAIFNSELKTDKSKIKQYLKNHSYSLLINKILKEI